ncbi:MAG: glycoside hydrolase family 2 TIM barrel-domain containing protein [Candidatus Izemoplasmatales bacterium]|nr:glycoside hydrolase family 2 TIM barrel-domain containing protein [Candidatus Izemoplasmatales bacterium]
MKRTTKSLNFNWYFTSDYKEEYLKTNFDFTKLSQVDIPHTMKELPYSYFNEKASQFIGTYFKEIEINESSLNNNLYLQFMGVMTKATIYCNNEEVFVHEGGYTPFTIKINDCVQSGKNILKVIVDGNEIKNIPPFGNLVDYLPYSGIYREVFLVEKPKIHIEKLHLFTDEINVLNQSEMLLNINIKVNEETRPFMVKTEIYDQKNLIQEHIFKDELVHEAIFSAKVEDIIRWEIDNPKLYNIKVSIIKDDIELDSLTEKFGFRTVMFTENGFLLNNKKIKLMGLNRHQSYPYIGYAAPKSLQEMDADILKNLGCNIVRTSHYMQSDYFINRCDEIGLLVFEEIPGWNYIGDENFKELTFRNLTIMINHHFNHPSICLWGTRINESKDDDELYQKTSELAKILDPTRQTGGVRNFKNSHLFEDVYTYNDFSHTGENDGLESPKKVTKSRSPYLVTEYNGHVFPTKKHDSEDRRIEHSLRHLNVIEYNYYYDNISGAIGWCLADYNTHFQFGSNDHICHHGVLDMHRIEKYAAYPYKSQKDPEEEVVLFIASNIVAGDYDELKLPEIIVYTNCDYLKVYRNDQFIDTYYPDTENYDFLPHAPVIINDLIGESLKENEDFKEKDAKKIKSVLLSYQKNGTNMPFKDKIKIANLMMRKVIDFNDAVNLFGKYLSNQDLKPTVFRIEGYLNDKLVKTVYKGHMTESKIIIEPDKTTLSHGLTYDMIRVIIKLVDQFDNVLDYANEVFTVETDENFEVVGPKSVSLYAGSIGIYLKTKKSNPNAKVKFNFNNYPSQEIIFNIEKGILEF